MAIWNIPEPGTGGVPCKRKCEHLDCEESRQMAARVCSQCGEEIGYNRDFMIANSILGYDVYYHTECWHEFQDQQMEAASAD